MKKLPFDKKPKKIKRWSMKKADDMFSEWIRARDGKCLRCALEGKTTTERLTCSHYWGRRNAALRYEPDNCITLCWFRCHLYGWEKEKHGKYRDFMIERLGIKRFEELRAIYYAPSIKMKDAIEKCKQMLAVKSDGAGS